MRLLWADLMKIIAISGVVLLHVSAIFLVPFDPTREWWIGNVFDSLSRWCVPLFVMVSGALILPKAEDRPLPRFFMVNVRRIFIPFLVWSVIYYLYRIEVKGHDLALSGFLQMLLTEPVYYHLWFIYMLIVLYLFAPPISAFLRESACKYAWYIIALWLFWASILPLIDAPIDFETYFNPDMDDYSALRLSGYFLLGYMLRDKYAGSGKQLFLVALLFIAGGAGTIAGTYLASRAAGEFHPFFYKYFSVTVVAMTVALFLFIKSVFHTRTVVRINGEEQVVMESPKLLRMIAMCVYGIYLFHAMVLELLRDGRLGFTIAHTSAFGMDIPQVIGIPLFTLSILICSFIPVFLIRLVPILRDILA